MNEENLENLNTKKMLFKTKQKTSECGGDTLSKKVFSLLIAAARQKTEKKS